MYSIGGNHERWPVLNLLLEHSPRDEDGFAIVRDNIRLAPRIHYWTWSDKKFLGVAGAASIDKDWRTPGVSWWPEEEITDAEIDKYITDDIVDVMVSHDCSNYSPWDFQLIPDLDSQIHRQRIDRVINKALPSMQFHGHMHRP